MTVAAFLFGFFFSPVYLAAQVEVPPPPNALPPSLPSAPAGADADAQPVDQEGVETLTRGPIHEAFANPVEPDPKPTPVVPDKPPADVPEQPPEYKPEGDYLWIPGYYEWDDDGKRFIWVTGVWRQAPPDKRWMPGYWHEVAGGWQRVRGFWIGDNIEHVTYHDTPPATLEVGPSSPQPANNYFWIPGNWNYVNSNYAWQAGYWAPYQQNWVWVPARWVWSPAGYVFLPGYWDYRLANRGQIFAPVYFASTNYRPGWFYRPQVVIPTSNLFVNLWLRPTWGSYYFGNYFGPQYSGLGFVAWSNLGGYRHQPYFYDPFYSYARVHYRQQGVDYIGRVQGWHNYLADHPEHRPPNTWREQEKWLANRPAGSPALASQLAAQHVTIASRQTDLPLKLTKVDDRVLKDQANHAQQLRELDKTRRNLEREHVGTRLPAADNGLRKADNALGNAENTLRNLDKSGTTRADKGATNPLIDRVEKGNKIGEKTATDTSTQRGNPVRVHLPKTDLPVSSGVTSGTTGGAITGAGGVGNSGVGNSGVGNSGVGNSGAGNNGAARSIERHKVPPLPLASQGIATQGGNAGQGNTIGRNNGQGNSLGQGNALNQGNTFTPRNGTLPNTGNLGNGGQGNGRGGDARGINRGGNLPQGGNSFPGGTNQGGQSTIRNFQPPNGGNSGNNSSGNNSSGNKGKKGDR
jgi:YXWGXW repeat-containing protein